jgi:DNA repair protein RadA/Sms
LSATSTEAARLVVAENVGDLAYRSRMSRSTPARTRPSHRCTECGWETTKWVGRCGECQAWGTVGESAPAARGGTSPGPVTSPAIPIGQVPVVDSGATSTGVAELDRVLGGGLVPGATVLLAGEPGVGKSTLLLEVAVQRARAGVRTLYVTGEESAAQVRLRADRTRGVHQDLYLAAETDLAAVLTHVDQVKPQLLVVDSVQTLVAADVEGVPGGVTQVKEVSAALVRLAKARDMATVLVGHVTKDGTVAGPRVLEHLVDVVLHFEGERSSRLRMLRAVKNRYGPVDEVGCFDLSSDGIVAVTDPSELFVARHHQPVAGTAVAVTMEGRRPMLAEVQALVAPSSSERPRRTTVGVDSARAAMIVAVLHQHAGVRLHDRDVFVSTVGGARVSEPAGDLAMAMAVASAWTDLVVPTDVVAIGEIGLAGELRRVRDLPQRLSEAARLGFGFAIVPDEGGGRIPVTAGDHGDLQVFGAADIGEALRVLDLAGSRPAQRPHRLPA